MKNVIEKRERECIKGATLKLADPSCLFRMISPYGFTNVIIETIKGINKEGFELSQKQAFEICNNEFQRLTGKPKYRNFKYFRNSLLPSDNQIEKLN